VKALALTAIPPGYTGLVLRIGAELLESPSKREAAVAAMEGMDTDALALMW
jgi:hypothetical protein